MTRRRQLALDSPPTTRKTGAAVKQHRPARLVGSDPGRYTCPNEHDRITCMPLTPMGFEDFLEPHLPAPLRKARPPGRPHPCHGAGARAARPSSSCAGTRL